MKNLVLIIGLLSLTACGFEVVDPGYRGIEVNLGKIVGEPLSPGIHYYNPFSSDIIEYSVQEQLMSSSSFFQSKDNQRVVIQYSVTYRPEPTKIALLWEDYKTPEALQEILGKEIVGTAKDAVGSIDAETINSKRDVIVDMAFKKIQVTLAKRHINVTSLQFTDISFDKDFTNAIEARATAIILAKKAIEDTQRIKEEKNQVIAAAQGEAEAMKIKSQALAQNKGLIEFEIAKKWDGALPVYMMGNSVPLIDFSKIGKKQ